MVERAGSESRDLQCGGNREKLGKNLQHCVICAMEKHKEGGFEGTGTRSTRYGRQDQTPLSPPVSFQSSCLLFHSNTSVKSLGAVKVCLIPALGL